MELTTEQHWHFFSEFCKLEMMAGGPDPHMRVVEYLSRDCSQQEKYWRVGCYVNPYNVPAAEVIWSAWSWERVLHNDGAALGNWLVENKRGLPTRPERRCVISPEKFANFLVDYATWLRSMPFERNQRANEEETYEALWQDVDNGVKYMGRYAKFKTLELLRRFGVPARLPDTRARGGWSPRLTLATLMPEHRDVLAGKDDTASIRRVDELAEVARERLRAEYDLDLDYYRLEVLLCDYRQLGRRQFPGHSQDSELKYHRKVGSPTTRLFEARAALFPHENLGEIQGWDPADRKPLSYTLERYGYLWSDSLYNFQATTDFANPVLR